MHVNCDRENLGDRNPKCKLCLFQIPHFISHTCELGYKKVWIHNAKNALPGKNHHRASFVTLTTQACPCVCTSIATTKPRYVPPKNRAAQDARGARGDAARLVIQAKCASRCWPVNIRGYIHVMEQCDTYLQDGPRIPREGKQTNTQSRKCVKNC